MTLIIKSDDGTDVEVTVVPVDLGSDDAEAGTSEWRAAQAGGADPSLRRAVVEMRRALEGMMRHSCVADAHPSDKDGEDHAAESAALRALSRIREASDAE